MLLVTSLDSIDFSCTFLSHTSLRKIRTQAVTLEEKKGNKVCKIEECSKMYMAEKYSGISY